MTVPIAPNEAMSRSVTTKIERLKGSKILFGFNLANDFTPTTKLFHQNGLIADMLLRPTNPRSNTREEKESHLAHPLWEDPTYDKSSIRMWDPPKTKFRRLINAIALSTGYLLNMRNFTYPARIANKYDLVISTPPGPFYFHKQKHNIVYDAGFCRYLVVSPVLRSRMATKAYQRAEKVLFTNPDMEPLFHKIGVENPVFMPFAVESSRYKPVKSDPKDEFTIFSPSRQDWLEKGCPQLIHAFANVVKEHEATMIITEFGKDIERTKALVKQLKIEDHVKYVGLVNKIELIERINQASVIADQFVIGSYGLAAPEAMACGKPVLMYIKEEENKKCFGDIPPVVNCRSIKSIEEQLTMLITEPKKMRRIAIDSRKWVVEKHSPQKVFEQQVNIIHSSLFD